MKQRELEQYLIQYPGILRWINECLTLEADLSRKRL